MTNANTQEELGNITPKEGSLSELVTAREHLEHVVCLCMKKCGELAKRGEVPSPGTFSRPDLEASSEAGILYV